MPTELLDLLWPPGWCSGCWPHDGEVAGGAVASSFLAKLLFADSGADDGARVIGATDDDADDDVGFAWSGRRRSSAARYGVIDNDRQIPQHRQRLQERHSASAPEDSSTTE